ncbi:MAG: AAA-associated domain-containing protein [Thermoplasmata archaeon]|nr:AAA-associated domain-containing protein [Candidatus Sysuiplasma acidicola]
MPNPHAGVSEIIGLLEAINDFSGSVDASVLADDFDLEIDEIYPAIESAELLGLISTPEGDVKLTDVGDSSGRTYSSEKTYSGSRCSKWKASPIC